MANKNGRVSIGLARPAQTLQSGALRLIFCSACLVLGQKCWTSPDDGGPSQLPLAVIDRPLSLTFHLTRKVLLTKEAGEARKAAATKFLNEMIAAHAISASDAEIRRKRIDREGTAQTIAPMDSIVQIETDGEKLLVIQDQPRFVAILSPNATLYQSSDGHFYQFDHPVSVPFDDLPIFARKIGFFDFLKKDGSTGNLNPEGLPYQTILPSGTGNNQSWVYVPTSISGTTGVELELAIGARLHPAETIKMDGFAQVGGSMIPNRVIQRASEAYSPGGIMYPQFEDTWTLTGQSTTVAPQDFDPSSYLKKFDLFQTSEGGKTLSISFDKRYGALEDQLKREKLIEAQRQTEVVHDSKQSTGIRTIAYILAFLGLSVATFFAFKSLKKASKRGT